MSTSIGCISDDVCRYILSWLDPRSIKMVLCISRRWRILGLIHFRSVAYAAGLVVIVTRDLERKILGSEPSLHSVAARRYVQYMMAKIAKIQSPKPTKLWTMDNTLKLLYPISVTRSSFESNHIPFILEWCATFERLIVYGRDEPRKELLAILSRDTVSSLTTIAHNNGWDPLEQRMAVLHSRIRGETAPGAVIQPPSDLGNIDHEFFDVMARFTFIYSTVYSTSPVSIPTKIRYFASNCSIYTITPDIISWLSLVDIENTSRLISKLLYDFEIWMRVPGVALDKSPGSVADILNKFEVMEQGRQNIDKK